MKQLFFVASSMIVLAMVSCRGDEELTYAETEAPSGMATLSRKDSANVNDGKGGDETKHKDRQQFKSADPTPTDSTNLRPASITLKEAKL